MCPSFCSCIPNFVLVLKPFLLLRSTGIPYIGLLTLLNFLFPRCDFLLILFFFNIGLCGPTLLGFWVGHRTTSVKITLSSRSISESTWSRAWWSEKSVLEWLSYCESFDKSPLSMLCTSKGKRDDFNFVFSRTVIYWLWLKEQNIWFPLQGEGVLISLLFFPLTFKPLYGM